MKLLYFTATGNSLYIAKRLGGEMYSIPQLMKENHYEFSDEKIGIIFPIYNWMVPDHVEKFLSKVKLNSNYIFAVMSYGLVRGGAVSHLLEVGKTNEIKFSYINTIKMVDNHLPGFSMENQKKNEHKKEIEKHLDAIIKDIKNSKIWFTQNSFLEKIMTNSISKISPHKLGSGYVEKFNIEETCTQCGICAKVCPMDNIQMNSNAKPQFSNDCCSCLACTQNCPQNAIRLKGEKDRTRFRNQHVTLKEIINANE